MHDLESIHEYIARDSEYYANRFIEKIIKSIEKLEKFPKIGRRIPIENIVELVRDGISFSSIIKNYYPDIEIEDIQACIDNRAS